MNNFLVLCVSGSMSRCSNDQVGGMMVLVSKLHSLENVLLSAQLVPYLVRIFRRDGKMVLRIVGKYLIIFSFLSFDSAYVKMDIPTFQDRGCKLSYEAQG